MSWHGCVSAIMCILFKSRALEHNQENSGDKLLMSQMLML